MRYKWLVVYFEICGDCKGFANSSFWSEKKTFSIDDIREIERHYKIANEADALVLLNLIPLEEEEVVLEDELSDL